MISEELNRHVDYSSAIIIIDRDYKCPNCGSKTTMRNLDPSCGNSHDITKGKSTLVGCTNCSYCVTGICMYHDNGSVRVGLF